MARFSYVALDVDGRRRSGGVDAPSESAARADLQRRKLLPVRIIAGAAPTNTQRTVAGPTEDAAPERDALSHKARLVITRQLATMIGAAVPVDEALGMIAAQQERGSDARLIEAVRADVMEGRRVADALGRRPRSFPPLYRAAVAGGERSGRLGFVLQRLADYLGRAHAQRTKVTTAMIYPAALSTVAMIVVVCLMVFVVPSLTEQFQSFEAEMPLLTKILIGVSRFLTHYWALLLLALAGAGLAARAALKQPGVRRALDGAVLNAPVIGKWAQALNASRFARAASTLIVAGVPVLESVRFARDSVSNRVSAAAIAQMADRIEEGEPFSHAMRRSGAFPAMVVYMAASGENTGDLAGMLEKAADHLDQEFEAFSASALSLLEPAIIVFMGAIVGAIVLSIMLPVLQLNQLALG